MQEFAELRIMEFTGFRKTNEEELNNLKKLGLKSSLGNPIFLESFFLSLLSRTITLLSLFRLVLMMMNWKMQKKHISVRNSTSQILLIPYRQSICCLPTILSSVYLRR